MGFFARGGTRFLIGEEHIFDVLYAVINFAFLAASAAEFYSFRARF